MSERKRSANRDNWKKSISIGSKRTRRDDEDSSDELENHANRENFALPKKTSKRKRADKSKKTQNPVTWLVSLTIQMVTCHSKQNRMFQK